MKMLCNRKFPRKAAFLFLLLNSQNSPFWSSWTGYIHFCSQNKLLTLFQETYHSVLAAASAFLGPAPLSPTHLVSSTGSTRKFHCPFSSCHTPLGSSLLQVQIGSQSSSTKPSLACTSQPVLSMPRFLIIHNIIPPPSAIIIFSINLVLMVEGLPAAYCYLDALSLSLATTCICPMQILFPGFTNL